MNTTELQDWLQGRLPQELLFGSPQVQFYEDELIVMLEIEAPQGQVEGEMAQIEQRLIARQREQSRPLRIQLARELQDLLRRPVAWGIRAGSSEELFTTRTAPVMTRLNRSERELLDTLVAAGVADTRSGALAYTVRAFATAHGDWLAEVREAIAQVQQVRSRLKIRRRSGEPPVAASTTGDE